MVSVKPLIEEFDNKGVKFLFVSSKEFLDEAINRVLNENSFIGENIRISEKEWNILAIMFNISGIPHKALIDKNGEVVQNNPVAITREMLLKLL